MFKTMDKQKEVARVILVDAAKINANPYQPRTRFDREKLLALCDSIKEHGIIQPLTVRAFGNEFELIAGERRLRAAKMAGLEAVPCIVSDCSDQSSSMIAIIENIQRADLDFFEEAEGINRLIENFNLTQEQVGYKLSRSQSAVANKLRLLSISEQARKRIVENSLTERHARALLKLEPEARNDALTEIIRRKLNVLQTELYIDNIVNKNKSKLKLCILKDIRLLTNTINKAIKSIKMTGLNADIKKTENKEFIEYYIKIPKETT